MKIALIDPSLFTWPYDAALMEGLRERGHEGVLYTRCLTEGEPGKHSPYVRELFYPGLQYKFMKRIPNALYMALKGCVHIFSHCLLLLALLRRRPDIIHFQWAPLPLVDRAFIPLYKMICPVIYTVHDSSPFNNNPKSWIQGVGALKIMGAFDHLIVHTEKAVQKLAGYGLQKKSITRIPHGVLNACTFPEVDTDHDRINLLLFGHLKPYKGADLLITALSMMKPDLLAKTQLTIAGKPQMDTAPLFELAKRLGVGTHIRWDLRFIDDKDIGKIFSSADVLVMPYREIDASGVLMLSIAAGKPLIATNIGLFSEILIDGVHGCLIPPESPEALAEAVSMLVADKNLRKTMAGNVCDLRDSIPSWSDIAASTETLYQKELQERNAA